MLPFLEGMPILHAMDDHRYKKQSPQRPGQLLGGLHIRIKTGMGETCYFYPKGKRLGEVRENIRV
jgi:hypothetical protein